jgi:hypothetical protein
MGFFDNLGGMFGHKVKAPKARNLGTEINTILGLGNELYQDAAMYSPQYTDLMTANVGRSTNAMTGNLLGQYGAAANQVGGVNTDLLAKFGGANVEQLRAMNPGQSELYDLLTQSAREGLAAGSRMTTDQMAAVRNPVRGNWAARGFSGDTLPAQLDEAVAMARAGDNVLGQRQQTAASVADLGNQFYTQPAANVALSAGGASGAELLGMGAGMGANAAMNTRGTFDVAGQYGSDVFNTNYNAKAAANIAEANNRTGTLNSALSY